MTKILITEEQLKTILIPYFDLENEKIKELKENWSKLSTEQKQLVLELYKILHPEVADQLNEGALDWFQTGLDVVGMIPGIGNVADLTNAVIYFGRGDALFGMLSLVSLIPFVGDAIAGPIILGLKAGGKQMKIFKTAVATKNATKIANAAKTIEKSGPLGKKVSNFVGSFDSAGLGKKIMDLLRKGKKLPIVGRFFSLIEDWVKIFSKASKEIKVPTKQLRNAAGRFTKEQKVEWSNVLKRMVGVGGEKRIALNTMQNLAKNKSAVKLLGKKLFTTNASKKLLFNTKLFARFLDHLGVANFIGPDEVVEQIPDYDERFADFVETPEGKSLFDEEITKSLI